MDRLCAAKDHYELQQGGAALLEEVRSNRELKKQNIQEKIDMLKKEKNIALSKVCASAMNCYKNIYYPFCFFWTHFSLYECMCVVLYHDTLESLLQKQCLEEEIVRLQRQLEMMETEYKLVDKTRVKALQVFKCMHTHFQYSTTGMISPLAKF